MSDVADKVLALATEESSDATLAERAFSAIVAMVLDGTLAPGVAVNEVDLSRRLAMTRGPVREAILRLQGRKLLTREPYQRARVVELGPQQMKEIFEFREAVEGVATRLATENMSDEALARLRERLEAKKRGEDLEFDLHWEIAQGCGNSRIAETLCDEIYHLLRMYRRVSTTNPERTGVTPDEHMHIVRAMIARDGELAESRMRKHIRKAADNLASLL